MDHVTGTGTDSLTYEELVVEHLRQPRFRRAWVGGYRRHEVDDLLRQVREVFDASLEGDNEVKERVDTLEAMTLRQELQIRELRSRGEELEIDLEAATGILDRITEIAEQEVATLLGAFESGHKRVDVTEHRPNESLAKEIRALRTQRDRLTDELNGLTKSYLRLLETIGNERMPDKASSDGFAESRPPSSSDVFAEIKEDMDSLDAGETSMVEEDDRDDMARSA